MQETKNTSPKLTKKEMQILDHLAKGLCAKEVATAMDRSVHTINKHVQNMLWKNDAHSTVGLIQMYMAR